jgi:hypothetical protein
VNAWVAQDPGSKLPTQRVFGGVEPANEKQMRGRFGNKNPIECLNQLRKTFVARQAADKTDDGSFVGNTNLLAHITAAGREALHVYADAASLTQDE